MRINKFLASAGLGSRRKVEQLILDGLVEVNGSVINNLACEIGDQDIVSVNGNFVSRYNNFYYVMLNKPKGYITSTSDDRGRKTVLDLLPNDMKMLKPVGRLDYNSEGLLILTNDGDVANKLTHPQNHIKKTYLVKIEGEMTDAQINKLENGIVVEGKKLLNCQVKKLECRERITKLEVNIFEGKNRQIRKMFEAIGFLVIFLKRIQIGEIKLSGVDRGKFRFLNDNEINYLKSL